MIRIAICDDDENFSKEFSEIIAKVFHEKNQQIEIVIFSDGKLLLEDSSFFDILFLDVVMPDITGIEVANILRQDNDNIMLIFVTWHEELVFDSLKYKPFRFLRKKFIDSEISCIIDDLIKEVTKINEFYSFKSNGRLSQIKLVELMYFEVYNHNVLLHIKNHDKIILNLPLSKIEKELSNKGFIRIHNSYLLNYAYIFSIEKSEVILTDKNKLPLSKHRINEVKQKLIYFERCL